mmetsp:Transcript_37449/g.107001  ORF Transcript_37449/g.107001 Transcript_37449/m.107001 type:complete len:203 (-) Transcript_37449:593-1201(-)
MMLSLKPPLGSLQSIMRVRHQSRGPPGTPAPHLCFAFRTKPGFDAVGSSLRCSCVRFTSSWGQATRSMDRMDGLPSASHFLLLSPLTPLAKPYSQSVTRLSPAAFMAALSRGYLGSSLQPWCSSRPPYWWPQASLPPGYMEALPPAQVLKAPAPPAPICRSNWFPETSEPVLTDCARIFRSTVFTSRRTHMPSPRCLSSLFP